MNRSKTLILTIIVISQFFCTSLWFAGNGIMEDLTSAFFLKSSDLGHLTTMVQFGFIIGTLIFALLSIADRFSPSKVFFVCALLGALSNVAIIWEGNHIWSLLLIRFLTGFFLAGIYPVGMKIASDYFDKGLGKSLGFLVGALVLGTAFPHFLNYFETSLSWKLVVILTSSIALTGGILIISFVPDGPFRKPSKQLQLTAIAKIFKVKTFRSAAFGYFGHMWELYAFWTFVPIIILSFNSRFDQSLNVSLLSFIVIAIGSFSCILGGYLSKYHGVKKVAQISLGISCLCCLISPFILNQYSIPLLLIFLLIWGMTVIADSPLFSTMVAKNAPEELRGTALTIVNCIGFGITIISIQLLNWLWNSYENNTVFLILAIGPILGIISLLSIGRK